MITLTRVLRANAASCIIFGAIFLWSPSKVGLFLGQDSPLPETLFLVLGAALIANGLHLVWASYKNSPSKILIHYFSIGDFIWVLATVTLLVLKIGITTSSGIVTSILVAGMVGIFGLLQIIKLDERAQ